MDAKKVLEDLKRRFPNEPEYHQAVEEVLSTVEEEYNKHPEFEKPSKNLPPNKSDIGSKIKFLNTKFQNLK